MNDTTRTVLIALGVALLVVVLAPILFMTAMMVGMAGGMPGMRGGWGLWLPVGLLLLALVAGALLLGIGVGRRR